MPARPGIFSYRGWTALSVLFVVLFGWTPESAAGEDPLEVIIVMDNSASMASSDPDFVLLASAELVVSLLRPGDRVHLVSSGVDASIVLSGTGEDREKFREALTRLHREASAADPIAVLDLLVSHFQPLQGRSRAPLVFWFTGRNFGYDPANPAYYSSEKLLALYEKALESDGFETDPLKVKAIRDSQPAVLGSIADMIDDRAAQLEALDVPVHLVVGGKGFEAPGGKGAQVTTFMSSMARRSGGGMVTMEGSGTRVLARVLSAFVATVNAPTQTVEPASMGSKGESFEVFRGCRHMWVVMLFDHTPDEMLFTAEDVAAEVVKTWPFGKPPGDVFSVDSFIEKGLPYKEKKWYRLPEGPVGYALYSVRDPLPGNYRIRVKVEKGAPFLIRILQDVDLEYGFLDRPADSIPLGMELSAVAALKNPEGYTYVFNRGFVDDLVFKVLMRSIDGTLPRWGKVQELVPSREGETSFTFSPDEPGTYYLKGKVTHRNGEFVAYMRPHRVDVHPRIPLSFEPVSLEWVSSGQGDWIELEPPLRIAPGVKLPADVEFILNVDPSGIEGSENLVFSPGESFTISREEPEVRFSVKLKDPDAPRIRQGSFEGKLRISVDDSQRQIVQGSGVWEIPVRGRMVSWGAGRLHSEYGTVFWIAIVILVLGLFVAERFLRPGFARGLRFESKEAIGGKDRRHTMEASRVFKPLIPFARQKIVVGRGGDVGLYREEVLCIVVPTRTGFDILPRAARILSEDASGDVAERTAPFAGAIDTRYRIAGDRGKLEFWLTREPPPRGPKGG